jgi:hypothetical protein
MLRAVDDLGVVNGIWYYVARSSQVRENMYEPQVVYDQEVVEPGLETGPL